MVVEINFYKTSIENWLILELSPKVVVVGCIPRMKTGEI